MLETSHPLVCLFDFCGIASGWSARASQFLPLAAQNAAIKGTNFVLEAVVSTQGSDHKEKCGRVPAHKAAGKSSTGCPMSEQLLLLQVTSLNACCLAAMPDKWKSNPSQPKVGNKATVKGLSSWVWGGEKGGGREPK